ncbi:MAG: Gfo/Idh/MocA family oxidoreductase [Acidobacteria bacterium]|nr:Gfo/Idh/MocA family oxidoreductase [Acidobacteriota bacterium]
MIRFGIVGFGLHAVKRLMPGFALAQNCRVTALSRRALARARQSAAEFNIPLAFDSARELCQSTEVDAVFIATPNACHLGDVLTAVECGKPVLCEKPMGIHAAECRQMVEVARQANLLLGVAQVFRFENTTTRLRERVHAGDVGTPIFARAEFSFPARNAARTWLYDAALAGGGPIADVGVHAIDALRYMLDDEVVSVSARAACDGESGNVEAAAALILEFSRGTLAATLVSFRADYRTPVEIVGDRGVLRADDGFTVERPIRVEFRRDGNVVDAELLSNESAYVRQVDMFAEALEGRTPYRVPGEEGWQNQEIIDAAYRSIKSGRAEAVFQVAKPETGRRCH